PPGAHGRRGPRRLPRARRPRPRRRRVPRGPHRAPRPVTPGPPRRGARGIVRAARVYYPPTPMATTDVTTHDWGDAPELYGPRHDYREALVLRRLLPALPGPRVLNAGAGAGSLTLKMVAAGLQVTSVD